MATCSAIVAADAAPSMNSDCVPAMSPGDLGAERPEAPEPSASLPEREDVVPVGSTLSPEVCAQMLKQRFPALFGGAPKPLKLRIQADIRERAPGVFSKAVLSAFLRRHTGRTAYLIALTRATHRFDLDGAPADEISDEHRQAARDELARRRALSESREALLEAQRRNRAELLRAFEGSSLSTANFCALKGVAVDELDGLLELARREADARARQPPADERRRGARPARQVRPERPRG
jgi:ProP effector